MKFKVGDFVKDTYFDEFFYGKYGIITENGIEYFNGDKNDKNIINYVVKVKMTKSLFTKIVLDQMIYIELEKFNKATNLDLGINEFGELTTEYSTIKAKDAARFKQLLEMFYGV